MALAMTALKRELMGLMLHEYPFNLWMTRYPEVQVEPEYFEMRGKCPVDGWMVGLTRLGEAALNNFMA